VRTLNPVGRHRERCREVRAQMSDYLEGSATRAPPRGGAPYALLFQLSPDAGTLRRKVAGLGAPRSLPDPPRMIRTPELYPAEASAVPNRA
jgi:hypothetical protein